MIENADAAFAGKAMAYIKHLYFAKRAREAGAVDIAQVFEETAAQDVSHAFAHLDLLYPKERITRAKSIDIAIEGETYEHTEMHPKFRKPALAISDLAKAAELNVRMKEPKQHASDFKRILEVGAKRSAACVKIG